jgi:hypothetical protein
MRGQAFTIAKFHARAHRTDFETLVGHSAETIKSGKAKYPMARVRALARLAEGIGLVAKVGEAGLAITSLGNEYFDARAEDVWSLTPEQKRLIRRHILTNPTGSKTLHAISSLLKLVKGGHSGMDLAHRYASEIGKERAWRSDVTYQGFTKFGLSYLKELGFLAERQGLPHPKKRGNRNPKWTRDELILALELYMRVNPVHTSDNNPEIVALSDILNSLPIHPRAAHGEKFRNANGVYMKLCNFLRFDPGYFGKGLQRGGRLEQVIWNEFAIDPKRLKATAAAILASASYIPHPPDEEEAIIDEQEEFAEGRLLTQLHKRHERNPLATQKKEDVRVESDRMPCV